MLKTGKANGTRADSTYEPSRKMLAKVRKGSLRENLGSWKPDMDTQRHHRTRSKGSVAMQAAEIQTDIERSRAAQSNEPSTALQMRCTSRSTSPKRTLAGQLTKSRRVSRCGTIKGESSTSTLDIANLPANATTEEFLFAALEICTGSTERQVVQEMHRHLQQAQVFVSVTFPGKSFL
jgi:hypothetical protein